MNQTRYNAWVHSQLEPTDQLTTSRTEDPRKWPTYKSYMLSKGYPEEQINKMIAAMRHYDILTEKEKQENEDNYLKQFGI